uniref:Uncharacterized protein n=1 Tax=Oryza sativa subsp. japonica TaxID=39947 RepID=Q5Z7R8_ORYSJ|nr:hypothetical protein [Oryza sativa Japonica Group]
MGNNDSVHRQIFSMLKRHSTTYITMNELIKNSSEWLNKFLIQPEPMHHTTLDMGLVRNESQIWQMMRTSTPSIHPRLCKYDLMVLLPALVHVNSTIRMSALVAGLTHTTNSQQPLETVYRLLRRSVFGRGEGATTREELAAGCRNPPRPLPPNLAEESLPPPTGARHRLQEPAASPPAGSGREEGVATTAASAASARQSPQE